MTRFEQLMEMKKDVKALKEKLSSLEKMDCTKENLEKIEAITARTRNIEAGVRQFARQYGMNV